MSNLRYLEIDSTYRNRTLFPLPSIFEVLISQSGTRDKLHAYDPISVSAPLIRWKPSLFDSKTGTVVTNPSNSHLSCIVSFTITQSLNKKANYYASQPVNITAITTNNMIETWDYISTDTNNDYFLMTFKSPYTPTLGDVITFVPSTDMEKGIFYIPDSVSADLFYLNYVIWNENTQTGALVLSFDGNTRIAGVNFTGWTNTLNAGDYFSVRKAAPKIFGDGLINTLNNKISLPSLPTISTNSDEYVNSFMYFTSGTKDGQMYRIIGYLGLPPLPLLPREVTLDCSTSDITPSDKFEILQFTTDNAVPFTYTGSLVSQQESVCYEIQLVDLILPNRTLKTGGRIAFYPYVYVELQNISGASAGNKNIIYSNNPTSTKKLFRASINDIPNALSSPFIKIDGDGMTQTVKFKPNDNFSFSVYLSDGTQFETELQESYGPLPAEPLVQISAMFSLKRL